MAVISSKPKAAEKECRRSTRESPRRLNTRNAGIRTMIRSVHKSATGLSQIRFSAPGVILFSPFCMAVTPALADQRAVSAATDARRPVDWVRSDVTTLRNRLLTWGKSGRKRNTRSVKSWGEYQGSMFSREMISMISGNTAVIRLSVACPA